MLKKQKFILKIRRENNSATDAQAVPPEVAVVQLEGQVGAGRIAAHAPLHRGQQTDIERNLVAAFRGIEGFLCRGDDTAGKQEDR